jgi:hypothetical protein
VSECVCTCTVIFPTEWILFIASCALGDVMCFLILLYMCPHTTPCVLILLYICPGAQEAMKKIPHIYTRMRTLDM